MKKKKLVFRLTTLAFALAVTLGALFTAPTTAEAVPTCHWKNCVVNGDTCLCCVQLKGFFECDNCGTTDCT